MSGHHNHAPKQPDARLVVVPQGVDVHPIDPPFKHYNFRKTETTPTGIAPERAFEHNTPGMESANYEPTDSLYGHLENDSTVAFKSDSQNVYAILESSADSANSRLTMEQAHEALTTYWSEVEQSGVNINKDNVADYMEGALRQVKEHLIAAGDDHTNLSAGMTMVKLF